MNYLFLHIPKTAGTSLRKELIRQFSDQEVAECYEIGNIPGQVKSAIESHKKLIYGHVNFNHLKGIEIPQDYQLLAFFRHPVQRCISTYIHFLHDQDDRRKQDIEDMGDFRGFLNTRFGNNFITRYVAGNFEVDEINDDELFNQAQANFEKLSWVGITERYGESLISLQQFMNLKPLSSKKENLSKDAKLKAKLVQQFQEEIIAANQLDLKLWTLANERLDKQLEKVPALVLKKLRQRLM